MVSMTVLGFSVVPAQPVREPARPCQIQLCHAARSVTVFGVILDASGAD